MSSPDFYSELNTLAQKVTSFKATPLGERITPSVDSVSSLEELAQQGAPLIGALAGGLGGASLGSLTSHPLLLGSLGALGGGLLGHAYNNGLRLRVPYSGNVAVPRPAQPAPYQPPWYQDDTNRMLLLHLPRLHNINIRRLTW